MLLIDFKVYRRRIIDKEKSESFQIAIANNTKIHSRFCPYTSEYPDFSRIIKKRTLVTIPNHSFVYSVKFNFS